MFDWAVGILVYNIGVVILLVGMSSLLADDSDVSFDTSDLNDINQSAFDTTSIPTKADLSVFQRFSYSLGGLPFYINVILMIPNLIF